MTKPRYHSLPRYYRPQKFSEVLGQDVIVTTLKNALRLEKTAYAYLFSGSRGVGKTTLARILAKALNCQNLQEDGEPCLECLSCKEIAQSRSLDVIEIDGASNRGIDDIRQINETVSYAPSSGKYKIYIIDEVHMLTKEAFNALLKTLEEPPAMVKFFFATTEPHKVLPTIISRCQRFDLRTISPALIQQKLKQIAKGQKREVTQEALYAICRFCDGSMRDAESLFDQILCFEEEKITEKSIYQTLGSLPKDVFFSLDQHFSTCDIPALFSFVEELCSEGKDLYHFLEELIEHFRLLLLFSSYPDSSELTHLPSNLQNKCLENSKLYSFDQLIYIIDFLLEGLSQLQRSPCKRVTLEMLFIKIARAPMLISLPKLVEKLEKMQSSSKEEPSPQTKIEPVEKNTPVEESNLPKKSPTTLSNKKQSHYDTVMQFASIELEATIHKKL